MTGTWECQAKGGSQGDMPFTLYLQQNEENVDGSVSSPLGSTRISSGTFKGDTLEIHIDHRGWELRSDGQARQRYPLRELGPMGVTKGLGRARSKRQFPVRLPSATPYRSLGNDHSYRGESNRLPEVGHSDCISLVNIIYLIRRIRYALTNPYRNLRLRHSCGPSLQSHIPKSFGKETARVSARDGVGVAQSTAARLGVRPWAERPASGSPRWKPGQSPPASAH